MKWLLTLFIALSVLCSCDRKDLQVKDYSFDTTYSMVDTICWKDERIALQLSIDNYNAEEELKLQYRINGSIEDTLVINGQKTLEPVTFDPHIDKSMTLHYSPKQKGANVICLTLSNSHFSRQDYITVRAKDEVTYDYKYNGYEIHITTIEGV